MKPTVLLLSTYPFIEPRHGGQIRLANIARSYEKSDWQVESIAIYEPEAYAGKPRAKNDIPFSATSPYRLFRGRSVPFINDLQSGNFSIAEDGGFTALKLRLPKKIDAIHVEQPWLWPLARKLKSMSQYKNAILVYGSQNIEVELKKDIFASYGIHDALDVIQAIDELEHQAAREADLTLAVTHADLNVLTKYGVKEILLAPNGIEPWSVDADTLEQWKARLPKAPWILYVASAHPPNFTGFTDCIGDTLGCIPPDSRLVIAGSVSEHLYQVIAATRWHQLNLSRLELLFLLSDKELAAVKTLAHAFLLPIQHGGGSNIKTAEALYSGAYIIGSEAAFRGFDDFTNLPEVTIARSPQAFQTAIRDTLQLPPNLTKNVEQNDLRYRLRWDQCLGSVPNTVAKTMNQGKI